MPQLLEFSRNRCTTVQGIDPQTIRSTCRLQDAFTDALVEIMVQLPDMNITKVQTVVHRSELIDITETTKALEKAVGVRIGPGMLKILEGLFEEDEELGQLVFMLEECCHGVILAFTKDALKSAPENSEDELEYYRDMVRKNIRLYNRCAAFAPGSAIVDGLEPPR